jgi:hypothetical protein
LVVLNSSTLTRNFAKSSGDCMSYPGVLLEEEEEEEEEEEGGRR